MKKSRNLTFEEDEKILFQTEHLFGSPFDQLLNIGLFGGLGLGVFCLIAGLIILILSISEFISGNLGSIIITAIIISATTTILGFILIPSVLYVIYGYFFQSKRTIIYISNKRIIKLIKIGGLDFSEKYVDIPFERLDYIIRSTTNIRFNSSLRFIERVPNKGPHFKISDTTPKKEPKHVTKISINLSGEPATSVEEKLISLILPLIPLAKHPYFDDLYLKVNHQ